MQSLESYSNLKRKVGRIDLRYRAQALFRLNLAYARMLLEKRMLTEAEYETIVAGLKASKPKVTEADIDATEHGDLWFVFEKALQKEIDPAVAAKLHIGRSRNDMYFSMYRMSLREALFEIMQAVLAAQESLEGVIAANLETVIPYYTYGQPSQPGTWGHYLLGVHEALSADFERLKAAYRRVNRSPMGSAAGIGSSFALDKARVAELLGFDEVIEHTNMAISAADYYLESIAACAILNSTLARVAADMMFLSSAECGVLDFDFEVCESSSIMPQKKNALSAELMLTGTEHFWGYLTTAFSSASGLSLFPTHEVCLYFDTLWDNVEALVTNVQMLAINVEHSRIKQDVALKRASSGFTAATAMAEQLTHETGIPFTRTHHVVGGMIRTLLEADRLDVRNMTPELLREQSVKHLGTAIERSPEAIQDMLDPLKSLNAKVTGGTPRPEDTRKLLEGDLAARKANGSWLKEAMESVERAFAKL